MHSVSQFVNSFDIKTKIVDIDIVHSDVKPENVLVFEKDNELVAKVNDFGCTCFGATENDHVDLRGISTQWMAPEQVEDVSGYTISDAKKVDAFSYGKVCAWLLFWQNSIRIIPDSSEPFDFDMAMDKLLNDGEPQSGELIDPIFLERCVPVLRDFFAKSYIDEPEVRVSFDELTLKLSSILQTSEAR